MDFILTTLSITLSIMLASVLMVVIMLQPWVMKAYTKFVLKSMENISNIAVEANEENQ